MVSFLATYIYHGNKYDKAITGGDVAKAWAECAMTSFVLRSVFEGGKSSSKADGKNRVMSTSKGRVESESSITSEISYGKSSEKLNWDAIVSKKGENRVEHIKRHTVQNNSRETHSVFNGNPIDMVNDAWEQRHLVEPISDGMGGTIYNIPYKNAGYESGYINTGAQMDYITIVTLDESTDLITAFPSFGDYHK